MAGGALAGGAATVVVAEKFGLSPVAAGGATAGVALAGSTLVKSPEIKDALYAASMGAGGLVGVQLLGQWVGRHHAAQAAKPGTPKRQAEGDGGALVTRDELNDALGKLANKTDDQHKRTCDLMTALHGEIKRVVSSMQPTRKAPFPTRDAVVEEHFEDEYMRNAYGLDEEDELRNARRARQQQRRPSPHVTRPTRRPVQSRPVVSETDDGSDYSDSSDDGSDSTEDSDPTDEQFAAEVQASKSAM